MDVGARSDDECAVALCVGRSCESDTIPQIGVIDERSSTALNHATGDQRPHDCSYGAAIAPFVLPSGR
ncbi:MAG: hypothetical protein CMH52_14105 [Myxococcales bacterium]|nr:hypothetical protein [Myxococcales bacterium]